jgi:hypothetical protein
MQTAFAYNISPNPWHGAIVETPYSADECLRIEAAIHSMVTNKERKVPYLLVPLKLITAAGQVPIQYYVAITRFSRRFNLVQFRVEINDTDVPSRTRPVTVPDHVKAKYPHIEFIHVDVQDIKAEDCFFWGRLDEYWSNVSDTICLDNPQYPGQGLSLGYDTRGAAAWAMPDGGTNQMHNMSFGRNTNQLIRTSIEEIVTSGRVTVMMVPDQLRDGTYIALIRDDASVNLNQKVVKVVHVAIASTVRTIVESMPVFSRSMGLAYPAWEFRAGKLTDMEKHILIQQPVREYHLKKIMGIVHEYHAEPRLQVLRLSLHRRLVGTPGLGTIGKECMGIVVGILRKAWTKMVSE